MRDFEQVVDIPYGQMDCNKAEPDEDAGGKDKDKVSIMQCVTDDRVVLSQKP